MERSSRCPQSGAQGKAGQARSRRARHRRDKRQEAAELQRTGLALVEYNPLTASFDTSDGTSVAAEVVYSADSASGVFRIAQIREQQRAAMRLADEPSQEKADEN